MRNGRAAGDQLNERSVRIKLTGDERTASTAVGLALRAATAVQVVHLGSSRHPLRLAALRLDEPMALVAAATQGLRRIAAHNAGECRGTAAAVAEVLRFGGCYKIRRRGSHTPSS